MENFEVEKQNKLMKNMINEEWWLTCDDPSIWSDNL